MDFVNDYKNEITYRWLKVLQKIDEENKNGQRLTYWNLLNIFGNDLWEFTDSRNEVIDQYERIVLIKNFSSLNLDENIKEILLQALDDSDWNQRIAAEKMGISVRRVNYLIKNLKITHKNWYRNK